MAADGLRLALTTFTVAPVAGGAVDRVSAGRAMLLAPVVGAGLGAIAGGAAVGLRMVLPGALGALLCAVVALGLLAVLTRGMHLDGLADTADGLGVYGSPEQALAAMKAPDVGAFGVLAVLFVVLAEVAAVARSVAAGRVLEALVVAETVGRLALPWSCTPRTPPARASGLGAAVAGTTTAARAAAITAVTVAGFVGWGWLLDGGAGAARAAVAVVGPLALAHFLRAHAIRRLGGVTGDVLGALTETATCVALIVLATG